MDSNAPSSPQSTSKASSGSAEEDGAEFAVPCALDPEAEVVEALLLLLLPAGRPRAEADMGVRTTFVAGVAPCGLGLFDPDVDVEPEAAAVEADAEVEVEVEVEAELELEVAPGTRRAPGATAMMELGVPSAETEVAGVHASTAAPKVSSECSFFWRYDFHESHICNNYGIKGTEET